MDKRKVTPVSVMVVVLWAIVGKLTYNFAFDWFVWIEGAFSVFGLLMFGVCLSKWMTTPMPEFRFTKKGRRQK